DLERERVARIPARAVDTREDRRRCFVIGRVYKVRTIRTCRVARGHAGQGLGGRHTALEHAGFAGGEQRRLGRVDVDGRQRDAALATDEGGDDLLDVGGVDVEPVAAREGGRLGVGLEVVLELDDLFLNLGLVDVRLLGGDQLLLHRVQRVLHRVHGGVGDVDLRGAEAERVLDGGHGVVVGTHGGRDRPVGGVVRRLGNAEAGGDAALRYVEVLVGGLEGLQRGHRAGIGVDARHGKYAPKQTGYWDIPGLSGLTGRHHAYGQLQRPTRHAWTCCTAAIPTKAIIGKGKLRRRNSGAPVHAKERTSEPTSRFQPSISTKN